MIIEEVSKNKTKTFFIVTLFITFVALFVYFISLWLFDNTIIALVIGMGFSIITSFISYYNSDKIVLSMNKARVATKAEYRQLNNSLEGLCIAAGLPLPKLYVMDDQAMNAFATGRDPEHAVICVTSGLLERLDKYEIEGVLGHELSHIKNYDILLSTIAVVMVGFVVMLSDLFSRGFIRSNRRKDDEDNGNGIIAIIGFIFILLSPIFAQLLQMWLSRNREYLADARSVEFTRNKDGLINALTKIADDNVQVKCANKATASLFIANPFKANKKDKDNVWSTHPSTSNRIAKLKKIS